MSNGFPGLASQIRDQSSLASLRSRPQGPWHAPEGDFIACLGGIETAGRFIARPFPDILEEAVGMTCVNFGWPNAGVEALSGDALLMRYVGRARLCVLQAPGAATLSNMYYRVHPRRNDRFLEATEALRTLYHDVDFTEFSFVRHMLRRLRARSVERFAYVRRELTEIWLVGMSRLIKAIEAPVVLLWLSARAPEEGADRPEIEAEPVLVDRDMLEALRGRVVQIVELKLGPDLLGADPGAACSARERRAAARLPGPAAHEGAAAALQPVVERLLWG